MKKPNSDIPTLDADIYFPIFKANDARFDGRIYGAVSSTGIYCRPVCRVKLPKKENFSFYASAAAAEAAGYRPCMRCRPELAPGCAPIDASQRLAQKAAALIEDGYVLESGLEELAAKLNVTDRHLRRIFKEEYGVSPVQYLQTCRLLMAKGLLTDTVLPITEIAYASGFGSIRRFNDTFKTQYRMSPSALRKQVREEDLVSGDSITLYLGYRPPYEWESMVAFLGWRTIPGVESVSDNSYHRTVSIQQGENDYEGWISVAHADKRNALAVTVSSGLLPVLTQVLARIRSLFDLSCDPNEIYDQLKIMNEIKEDICLPGTRLPGSFDPFEMAVRAVLGQQITVKAARTLAARITEKHGKPLETPIAELTHSFPTAEYFVGLEGPIEEHLGPLGVTGARARSIKALATALVHGEIELSRSVSPEEQMEKLLALPGFGPWTVHYLAMRALSWPDAFPHTDYGVKKALEGYDAKEILALAEAWRPWRSYATINLWNSLS